MKTCPGCEETKPKTEYHKNAARGDGVDSYCRPCRKVKTLKYRYGILPEEYNKFYVEQQGCCAICLTIEKACHHSMLYVDHCHSTGEVRGLLCRSCNVALGFLKDDIEILESAIKYLQ